MLKQANSTAITLVAKVVNPIAFNNYIPISCCNGLYKVISKILSCWHMEVFYGIIHLNQSIFIHGRRIIDNILLAHELVRGYYKGKDGCYALKVDIQKAYDSYIFMGFY